MFQPEVAGKKYISIMELRFYDPEHFPIQQCTAIMQNRCQCPRPGEVLVEDGDNKYQLCIRHAVIQQHVDRGDMESLAPEPFPPEPLHQMDSESAAGRDPYDSEILRQKKEADAEGASFVTAVATEEEVYNPPEKKLQDQSQYSPEENQSQNPSQNQSQSFEEIMRRSWE